MVYCFWKQLEQRLTSVRAAMFVGEPLFRLLGLRFCSKNLELSTVRRILVIRLDEIGDVVLLSPFLRELRRNAPTAWITLIVRPSTVNLVAQCPYVSEIVSFDCSTELRVHRILKSQWLILKLAVTRLWKRRFDIAISPRRGFDFNHQACFLAYFSGAKWRVGYSEGLDDPTRASSATPYFDCLLTHPLRNVADQHTVQHNLAILRAIGGTVKDESLEFWLSAADQQFAAKVFAESKLPKGAPLLGLAPGALHGKRQWPLQNFIAVAQQYIDEFAGYVVMVGGWQEKAMGKLLRSALGPQRVIIATSTTLRESAALLARCTVFVGNDTGPMHLAAAVKVPAIEVSCHPLSGSRGHVNSPVRFGPWGVDSRVLQPAQPLPPCADGCAALVPHCITQVQVAEVQAAIRTLMATRARPVEVAQPVSAGLTS